MAKRNRFFSHFSAAVILALIPVVPLAQVNETTPNRFPFTRCASAARSYRRKTNAATIKPHDAESHFMQTPTSPELEESADTSKGRSTIRYMSILLAVGWLGTNLAYNIAGIPFQLLLKNEMKLSAPEISAFMFWAMSLNYIKPFAGILTDSVPLFGTRRRSYLLISLTLCGLGWLLLSLVPRRYGILLTTYFLMYAMVVFISTTLGGVMVEIGTRFKIAGRLTAQRIAMFKVGALFGSPLGGYLATRPFVLTASIVAGLHFMLIPFVFLRLKETRNVGINREVWKDAGDQLRGLVKNRTLLIAAVMICLIAIAPGFNTPLLFYQTDTLKFDPQFLGYLAFVHAAFGISAAVIYRWACVRLSLKTLITSSIIIHAVGTLFYLGYQSRGSAIAITALEGIAQTLALLPVYDIAARATPKGSEALGYSIMMSAWNLTGGLSDWTGSVIYSVFNLTFQNLVWLNSATTLLALIAVPMLPAVLLNQSDSAKTPPLSEEPDPPK